MQWHTTRGFSRHKALIFSLTITSSCAGTQSHVRRQDLIQVRGDLNLIVGEIIHPGSVPPGRVDQSARNVSESNSHIFRDFGRAFFLTRKNPEAMAHVSSLMSNRRKILRDRELVLAVEIKFDIVG